MRQFRHCTDKILSLPLLLKAIKADRYANTKLIIGLSNGCFGGLVHPGHIHVIEHAATYCDKLIVAINSDFTYSAIKGHKPILPWFARASGYAALEAVDYVVEQVDPTPHRLIELIRPDVLVKGATSEYPVGHEIVDSYGGRVIVVPALAGWSTAQLLVK